MKISISRSEGSNEFIRHHERCLQKKQRRKEDASPLGMMVGPFKTSTQGFKNAEDQSGQRAKAFHTMLPVTSQPRAEMRCTSDIL